MVHETNIPGKYPTMTAEKYVEKLPSTTDPVDNNFVSSDTDNCINNVRRSEKKNAKRISQEFRQIARRLLIVGDSIVKNIEPYKMEKGTKYVITVKSILGAREEGMIQHIKSCMVDFTPDNLFLHCATNGLKKDFTLQKTTQNILKLAEEVSDRGNLLPLSDTSSANFNIFCEVMIIMLKCKR